ncbi:MAG: flavodoxin family protein [Sedimentibacter sp.]
MNYKVVYFTRTENSKRIAEKIANKLSCEIIQVTDDMNWNGPAGYIKAGYYSVQNKSVTISINGNLEGADEFIVVAPLWAGGIPPAIKVLLNTIEMTKVHLVVTSMGSLLKDRTGYKSVSDVVKSKNNEDTIIDELINSL